MKRVLMLSLVVLSLVAPAYAGRLPGDEIQAPRHDEIQAPVRQDEIQAPRAGGGDALQAPLSQISIRPQD